MRIFHLFSVVFLLAVAVVASTHKYHTTFMTIEQNIEEKNLEITLKVFTHDLVPMLEKRMNQKVDLGSTEGIDLAVQSYIGERFAFKTKSGESLKTKWIGKELDAQVAYFYLEIPFDSDFDGASVSNSLFFEHFKEQINYVSFKSGENKTDLVFKAGDGEKRLKIEN